VLPVGRNYCFCYLDPLSLVSKLWNGPCEHAYCRTRLDFYDERYGLNLKGLQEAFSPQMFLRKLYGRDTNVLSMARVAACLLWLCSYIKDRSRLHHIPPHVTTPFISHYPSSNIPKLIFSSPSICLPCPTMQSRSTFCGLTRPL
jgi:hypothetical protein